MGDLWRVLAALTLLLASSSCREGARIGRDPSGRLVVLLPPVAHRRTTEESTTKNRLVWTTTTTRGPESTKPPKSRKPPRSESSTPRDLESDSEDLSVVRIEEGRLRGTKVDEPGGFSYYTFLGVPYAEKPERFEDSRPVVPWQGVRDATVERQVCPQRDETQSVLVGDEDCLWTDVATPSPRPDDALKRPVLVWIHGGMFKYGTARFVAFDPRRLVRKGCVCISIAYRLGAFGFLSTAPTQHARGNYALRDVMLALRWIRSNARHFGGDPDNVTLYGLSSGSMVIEMLTLMREADGLYHKVILSSGSVMNWWSTAKRPLRTALALAARVDANATSPARALRALRSVDALELVRHAEAIADDPRALYREMPFVMTAADGEYAARLLRDGRAADVPTMIVHKDFEGLHYFFNDWRAERSLEWFDEALEEALPRPLLESVESRARVDDIVRRVRALYFDASRLRRGDGRDAFALGVARLMGDTVFACGVHASMRLRQRGAAARRSRAYALQFAHSNEQSRFIRSATLHDERAAGHTEELYYVFRTEAARFLRMPPGARPVADALVAMWANFARHGNPTPNTTTQLPVKWLPITEDKLNYLKMTDKMEMLVDPLNETCEFWNDLHKEYLKPFHY